MLANIFMEWLKYRGKSKAAAMKMTAGVKAGAVVRKGVDKGVSKASGSAKSAKAAQKGAKGAKGKGVGLFNKKDQDQQEGGGGGGGGGRGGFGGGPEKTVAIRIDFEEPLEVVGWVVALNGHQRGQDYRLHTGKNSMGTAADCDIVLTDPYLSSRHTIIRHDSVDGSFVILDLDSTNGTFVNDKRVAKDEIIDNDTIRLGRTELKFKALF